ncbi:TauD/TfdA family dioxygenase [Reyranella sp. CPCC 100927]|uniref:TauD/TfdA dioxygenase family protein n=1 Tax=Reyranella sp. CPCC 100927 TaxID=2599616 RepID=UPI0011B5DA70|nr:TauD/TfdA family dioxygenase [Reyranella sp. CPCC 100927]TWS98273.1 TauD/TfdA family dioxygenase [Reyranella sp. CPCC 100927]
MTLTFRKLHPLFGVEIGGADLTRPVDAVVFGEIRAAFEEHSVVLLRDQPIDDAQQVAFTRLFGPLETTVSANPAGGTAFARQSNLDINTGVVIPPEDRRMIYQKANYFWHTDSSFKKVPALCSLLSGRLCPPEGGDTEFASLRAAYAGLSEAMKQKIETLVAEHSLAYSRSLVDPTVLTEAQKAEVPPVQQRLVRVNPINGRKALYVSSHASHIVDQPFAEGRALLDELTAHATQPAFCWSHQWRQGDLIIWDNRAVLHRATPYDAVKYKRLMQRTTVAGDAPTVTP